MTTTKNFKTIDKANTGQGGGPMANPQPTDAHIRIAHSITEAIMLRDFSKRQRKILDLFCVCPGGVVRKQP